MSDFDIHVRRYADGETVDEEGPASISIRARANVFTRLLRPGRDEADNYLIAPPERLAFWLVDNWWRVRWECIPPTGMSTEWRLAHELSSIGGGYPWPRLTIWGEDERVGLMSRMDPAGVVTPVRFLTDALEFVDGVAFEAAVDRFLDEALAQWTARSEQESLRVQMAYLRTDRQNPEFAAWRRLEARLGFAPDEAPETLMDQLADLVAEYGESGVEEAAQAAPGAGAAATLVDEIEAARNARDSCDFSHATEYVARSVIDPRRQPWELAERASALVRRGVGADRGPLLNPRLAEILGTRKGALGTSHAPGTNSNHRYGLRLHGASGTRDLVSLRSRWSHDRRFELSRALGDAIWAGNDALGPLARSKTARQKFQRAFAQSLLCPFEDLLDFLGGTPSPSDGDLTAAAKHFHVSARVVQTVLVNKRYADRELLGQSAANGAPFEVGGGTLSRSVSDGASFEDLLDVA